MNIVTIGDLSTERDLNLRLCNVNLFYRALTSKCCFFTGFTTYLSMVHHVYMPPNQNWFCTLNNTILFASTLCSTLFIVSMTFDRFYSIIRPHKAASFNTVKRAKTTIICIVIFSIMYNVPHLFISTNEGLQCVPYGKGMQYAQGQFYYWLSFAVNFALPFVLLLIMNCFIIHTIRNRAKLKNIQSLREKGQDQGQCRGEGQKLKSSETQVYVILLLVTFAFLILTTPAYVLFIYMTVKRPTPICSTMLVRKLTTQTMV